MSIRDIIGGLGGVSGQGGLPGGEAGGRKEQDASARGRTNARLLAALDQVASFPPGRAAQLGTDRERLAASAADEARSGEVSLDARGLTAGERLAVIQPARRLVAEWYAARSAFDVAVEPFMPDLEAASRLEEEIRALSARSAEELEAIDHRAGDDHEWQQTRDRYGEARSRFEQSRLAHANRDANMRSHHWSYWVALVAVGAAEWLINYDTLVMFFGIPAMAIGATAILAFAMAFASHAHGLIWKQWSSRFGRHHSAIERASSYRLLGLGTLALLFVTLFAGFARFSVVMHQEAGQPAQNILGAQAAISVDPSRDVLISMLANLLAWLVGTFVSFFCHDEDPVHAASTRQFNHWQRRFLRVDRPFREEREVAAARAERELAERRSSAEARRARVRPQSEMLAQVQAHETAVLRALLSAIQRDLASYRGALADEAVRQGTAIVQEGAVDPASGAAVPRRELSPHMLRSTPHAVDLAYVAALA